MSTQGQYSGGKGQRDEKDLQQAIRQVDEVRQLTDINEIKKRLEEVSTLLVRFQA